MPVSRWSPLGDAVCWAAVSQKPKGKVKPALTEVRQDGRRDLRGGNDFDLSEIALRTTAVGTSLLNDPRPSPRTAQEYPIG